MTRRERQHTIDRLREFTEKLRDLPTADLGRAQRTFAERYYCEQIKLLRGQLWDATHKSRYMLEPVGAL